MSGFGGRTIRSIERNYSRPWATRMSNRALSSVQIRRPGTKTEEMRSELREMIQKSVQHGSSIKDKARINFATNLV